MNFLNFQAKIRDYPVFTRQDLKIIFPKENHYTVDKQLYLWSSGGKIIKLKNGLYVLGSDYTKESISAEVIAAKLYTPSYISLEYALSAYGLIPEAVFDITSVTSKITRIFETPLGFFRYRSIKPSCFFGFYVKKINKLPYYMAEPEKALLDFLYLNKNQLIPEFQTWKAMRLQNTNTLKFSRLIQFAKQFHNKKLMSLVLNLKKYAKSC